MNAGADTAYLAANLASVRERVAAACRSAGRDPAEVGILPVSKTFDAGVISAAVALGLHRFGENRVQEVREKSGPLADSGIEWVIIGPLQTNKARDVARLASEVQTLDRLELAEALDHRLQIEGRAIEVLVQVKTSPEESKHGLAAAELPGLLAALARFDTLGVRGLMTLATHTDDEPEVRRCFRDLRQLRDRMAAEGYVLPRLSMGMSGDFPLAIAEGATEVRIGSAIFGRRPPAVPV
jgi:pyridoxal phosphate enzyme (YggS family)